MIQRVLFSLTLGGCLTLALGNSAAEDIPELIPEDECILEFELPEGSTVEIDGKDRGKERKFLFSSLQPNRFYPRKSSIRFPSGKEHNTTILVQGGKHIAFALNDPDSIKPELVLQRGSCQWQLLLIMEPSGFTL